MQENDVRVRVLGQALEGGLRVIKIEKETTHFHHSRRRVASTAGRWNTNLLHLDLVVHVRMSSLNFVDLGLLDELEGESLGVALPGYFVDGRVVARAELAQKFKMF